MEEWATGQRMTEEVGEEKEAAPPWISLTNTMPQEEKEGKGWSM